MGATVSYIKGKSGWLFLDNDRNGVIDEISGKHAGSEALAASWCALFAARNLEARSRNVSLTTFIVPNKHCALARYLPDSVTVSENRLAARIQANAPASVVYGVDLLGSDACFHKNDTHWTDYGAYLAFGAIMQAFGITPAAGIGQEAFIRKRHVGDLTHSAGTEDVLALADEWRVAHEYDNGIIHVGRIRIHTRHDRAKTGRSLVIFGGSSSEQIISFFAHEFDSVFHFWTQAIDWDVVQQLGCTHVLSLPRERFMVEMASDDMTWEYRQRNALKFLSGTGYKKENVTGFSPYFGQMSYLSAIQSLAVSLVSLHAAGNNVGEFLLHIFAMRNNTAIRDLLNCMVAMAADAALIERVRVYLLAEEFAQLSEAGKRSFNAKTGNVALSSLDANALRDSAIALEDKDLMKAEYLMSLAAACRPTGPVIASKLEFYRQEIARKEI